MFSDKDILRVVGRTNSIFEQDFEVHREAISMEIKNSKILVIGGAGSIGQAVSKQLFSMCPNQLHVVDNSENNLVELVRDIRSSLGYISGEFKTFVLDFTTEIFEQFLNDKNYDYVFNLAALKHVRSEKDPYTLMNLLNVNVIGTVRLHKILSSASVKKYFVVSSDKASAPANLMGASKLLMENFLRSSSQKTFFSSARFANVAFSDGSLLFGFKNRIEKHQPISIPSDVKRYFVSHHEAGRLCLLSCFLGDNRNIFYPNLSPEMKLTSFSDIAIRYLESRGLDYKICDSEDIARDKSIEFYKNNIVPLFLFSSDTTGEKPYEEFIQLDDIVDTNRFKEIGVILGHENEKQIEFENFVADVKKIYNKRIFEKRAIVDLFEKYLPHFDHEEKNKYLDEKM